MSLSLAELNRMKELLEQQMENFDVADHFCKDRFEKIMNDNYDPVTILNMTFEAGTALRKLDSDAFYQEYHNFCDSFDKTHIEEYNELQEELWDIEYRIEEAALSQIDLAGYIRAQQA